jgi:hypothetical protein
MLLLINYSLYRKLFNKDDKSIYQQIWALQKFCPVLVVYNNLYAIPGDFLSRIVLKSKIKVDPPDVKVFLKNSVLSKDQ